MSDSIKTQNNIIVGSEIIISRNLDSIVFPFKLGINQGRELSENISKTFMKNEKYKFKKVNLWQESKEDIGLYIEQGVVSSSLFKNKNISSFVISEDKHLIIMINGENHITVRLRADEAKFKELYEEAKYIMDFIEQNFDIAFHEKFGYLNSSINNLGTAFRVSSVIHLPILNRKRSINQLNDELNQVGLCLEDIYVNENIGISNLYRVYNKVTIGVREEEILNDIEAITYQLVMKEKNVRKKFLETDREELEDKIFRAEAILSNARKITFRESLDLLSMIRLGVEMDMINNLSISDLNSLCILIQQNNIYKIVGQKLTENEEKIKRAWILRKTLGKSEI
ncbi:hypothetical protein [Clostridium mediterraneense]|uniref:hypothetical protein n=1 Tax=Clostridium mediterraneense TaxID=1805472 RepID=UPI00082FD56D|nr:hypothetical protein [Clostridium mediterraneense]